MGAYQASVLEAMQSLRDEFKTIKKASEAEVDQISVQHQMKALNKQA